MSILSFDEIRSIRDMLKGKNKEHSLMTIAYLILGADFYLVTAILFSRYDWYSLPPFNFVLKMESLSVEIAKNTIVVLSILYLCFIVLLIYLIWRNRYNFPFLRRGYRWSPDKGLSEWEFQGNIIVDHKEKALHIVQSDLGCIIRNRSWKNFTMSFEFKIPDPPPLSPQETEGNRQLRRGFGIIYRAKHLGEYYMIKIDENGCLPHVRNLYWENNGPIWKPKLNRNDLNRWVEIKLTLIENNLTIEMKGQKFDFLIPTHSTVHREAVSPEEYQSKAESHPFLPIKFRNSGSVGFRSAHFEEVLIRNLNVKEELLAQFIERKCSKKKPRGGETIMLKCPKCEGENVEKTGVSHDTGVGDTEGNIASSRKQSGYRCEDCGEHFSAPAS